MTGGLGVDDSSVHVKKKVHFGEVSVIKPIHSNAETICNTNNKEYHMFCRSTLEYGRQRVYTTALIDSGSKSSLMGYSTFLRLGKKLKLEPPTGDEHLVSADGETINMLGYIRCNVKLGSKTKFIRFKVVENLISSVILGADDLSTFGAVLDFGKSTLTVDGQRINLIKQFDSVSMVAQSSSFILPGEIGYIRMKSTKKTGNCSHVFDPKDIDGLETISQLLDLNTRKRTCAVVHNVSDRVIKINKGQILGNVSPVSLQEDVIYLNKKDIQSMSDQIDSIHEDEDSIHEDEDLPSDTEPACATIKKDTQKYVKKGTKKKKKKNKRMSKPTHSRPLVTEDVNEEQVIRDKLKMKTEIMSSEQIEQAYDVAYRNRPAFSLSSSDMGGSKSFEYNLELKPDAELMFQPAYKLSAHESSLLEKECQKWKKLGIIDEASETVDLQFLSPALLTSKTDGSARLITDMRLLGAALKRDNFSLPSVNDCFRRIGAAYELENHCILRDFTHEIHSSNCQFLRNRKD